MIAARYDGLRGGLGVRRSRNGWPLPTATAAPPDDAAPRRGDLRSRAVSRTNDYWQAAQRKATAVSSSIAAGMKT
jgi:hypothetical protein